MKRTKEYKSRKEKEKKESSRKIRVPIECVYGSFPFPSVTLTHRK
jgi:hypothetical protein